MLQATLASLVIALAAFTLISGGCGGSSKTESTSAVATTAAPETTTSAATATPRTTAAPAIASGKPLTRAEWIAKGDAICARTNAETKAIHVKAAAEFARTLPQTAAYKRAEVAELAKLTPPTSKASDWQLILNEVSQIAEYSAKLAGFAKLGDAITKAPLATSIIKTNEHLVLVAKRDGFKACSLS
jgi:hypothetical protein